MRPLHRLHKCRKLDNLAPQRAVEHPASPKRNLRWASLGTAQHNLDSNIACTDSCDGCDVVEKDQSKNEQADQGRAKFDELHGKRACITMVPAVAGTHY